MFEKTSEMIYRHFICAPGRKADGALLKKLAYLYPASDLKEVHRNFYLKRIGMTLTAVSAGCLLALFMKLSVLTGKQVPEDGFERDEWNGRKQTIELYAISQGERAEVDIGLETRLLSEEELDVYSDAFLSGAEDLIRGDNPDLMHVSSDLVLCEKYEEYPFRFSWRSSDSLLVSAFGGRVDTGPGEGDAVLTARYTCGDYERTAEIPVHIIRPDKSPAEQMAESINEDVSESQIRQRGEKIWKLPEEYEGSDIRWEYRVEDNSMLILGLFLFVSVIMYMASVNDLDRRARDKKENLKRSYPKILRQLSLYVGAGMTVRSAFSKIAEDAPDGTDEEIYEEMRYACHEMKQGFGEADVYERFGKRTGLPEYIKLCGMLSGNLKRGNPAFIARLREEAGIAMRERVLESRKKGEEAQTKLLAPMMMMLAVVMVMIMIPAMTGIKI